MIGHGKKGTAAAGDSGVLSPGNTADRFSNVDNSIELRKVPCFLSPLLVKNLSRWINNVHQRSSCGKCLLGSWKNPQRLIISWPERHYRLAKINECPVLRFAA